MSAPPGLGPPGVWHWPDPERKYPARKTSETNASHRDEPDSREEENAISWPETFSNSTEVEFVGRVARYCFGDDFMRMTVSWTQPCVQGLSAIATANLDLHLRNAALANVVGPLVQLQAALARDQRMYECQIFRMERSKDNTSLHLTCARVSIDTCWDALKTGCCRPNCPWEHPAPTFLRVCCAGQRAACPTPLATLMPRLPVGEGTADKIQRKAHLTIPTPVDVTDHVSQQLNIGAYDDDYDDP